MEEEYLDIIDKDGNLTGEKQPRSIVHERGLRHRTVYVFLYKILDSQIYFLAQQRSATKDRHPNEWTIVNGGHVKAGLSVEEGAKCELYEEIGLNADQLNVVFGGTGEHVSQGGKNRELIHLFFCDYDGKEDKFIFNDGEVQAVAWRNINEVIDEIKNCPGKWADRLEGINFYIYSLNKILQIEK